MRRWLFLGVATLIVLVLHARPADATTITFQATDLADVAPGQDLWEYRYNVSGQTFLANQGFTIYFNPQLYDLLEDPPPLVNGDWDIFVAQPNAAGMLRGFYDAFALVDGASLADPFVLTFNWLGAPGAPGSQSFTVNQFDLAGNLVDAVPGLTVPFDTLPGGPGGSAVPEPATLTLMGAGAVFALMRRRRHP